VTDEAGVWIIAERHLPTGVRIAGFLMVQVAPGQAPLAIVGRGPMRAGRRFLTAQFYFAPPKDFIMIDLDDNRLKAGTKFGATATIKQPLDGRGGGCGE